MPQAMALPPMAANVAAGSASIQPSSEPATAVVPGAAMPAPSVQQLGPRAPEHTGVTFDWPETVPGSRKPCRAGHYVGSYMCRLFIINTTGEGAFDVNGTVDMLLEQSTDGELLRVQNGKFLSATLAAIPVRADLFGELDCSASKFEGRLENGVFSVALDLGVPFTEGTFSGPLSGDYEESSASLRGVWNMQGELDGFPGTCMNGSWSATWQE